MAELTTKRRKKLPDAKFAGPGRSYPVQDKAHARNAKARASQQVKKGHLSAAEVKRISSTADKVLGNRS